MASQIDLAPRLAALQAAGLKVTSEYKSTPAAWLMTVLVDSDAHVINAKGVKPNDIVCMVRLSKLEALIQAAALVSGT